MAINSWAKNLLNSVIYCYRKLYFVTMIIEEDIAQCHFVPMKTMKRVMNLLDNPFLEPDKRCKRNLLHLQTDRSLSQYESRDKKWRNRFHLALCRAIYSHNWDKLLYLLKKSPIWEHQTNQQDELGVYIRALIILLMNHPSAKEQSLLDNYLHMVLSCRSDQDKKAVYKVILSLTPKLSK